VKYCSGTKSLIETISEARLFICNNTGVLWVANLLGVETVSFATPFFFPSWDPRELRNEINHVLVGDRFCDCVGYRCKRGNCIHEIETETVFQLIKERVQ
jgi:ADP-heptose:LPS heptosyltransferase